MFSKKEKISKNKIWKEIFQKLNELKKDKKIGKFLCYNVSGIKEIGLKHIIFENKDDKSKIIKIIKDVERENGKCIISTKFTMSYNPFDEKNDKNKIKFPELIIKITPKNKNLNESFLIESLMRDSDNEILEEAAKVKISNIKLVSKTFRGKGCSLFKCDQGYYCATHRCRSEIYSDPKKIPQKQVDFVATTG